MFRVLLKFWIENNVLFGAIVRPSIILSGDVVCFFGSSWLFGMEDASTHQGFDKPWPSRRGRTVFRKSTVCIIDRFLAVAACVAPSIRTRVV